ncbi:ice-binding family protein [Pseudoclavibacter terrae]|uniref:ice-binding family protein n=1 Tax=Pseudoclavibacter terrae TaxID=1530195 RepID=UPI00232CCA7B|nr:ice-binding family protein [Pseudoclavibacter terrae]
MANPTLPSNSAPRRARIPLLAATGSVLAVLAFVPALLQANSAQAIGTAVDLGTASSFSVLGGASVSNTGDSILSGDLGVAPGSAISGFPPGIVLGETRPLEDAAAAQSDAAVAYNALTSQASDAPIAADLGGQTLVAGVYKADTSAGLTGTVTLDAEGDPNAVFIFQIGSTLTTAPNSTVALVNGAQACNVFWQVGSSATLDTDTTFVGTIIALASVTVNTDSTIAGRAIARTGSVTLDDNTFTPALCAPPTETEQPTVPPTETETEQPTVPPTETETEQPTVPPTETEQPTVPPTETEQPTVPPTETEQPTVPPTETEEPTVPPTETEQPTVPPTETEQPTVPPTETEQPTVPPTETEQPTVPPTETEQPTASPTTTSSASPTATSSVAPGPVKTTSPELATTGAADFNPWMAFGAGTLLLGGALSILALRRKNTA